MRVKPEELSPAKCAKFYPLIDELMHRADNVASATSELMKNEKIRSAASHSSEKIKTAVADGASELSTALSKDNINGVSDKIQSSIPEKDELNQIYSMLKDEDLT
eukprot:11922799-Ditylum_brightwellii.AAC.1